MATDPDSIDPTENDPASLAEALPDSDRGQGAISPNPAAAIAEAAAQGVNLTDDGTGAVVRSAGTGSASGQA
ncbi:MAG: hypothetical protein JWL91_517 [Sphingomonas bacterium]|nr:hypothetical protein [Sphingomonas bacterium]MDB5688641.1 hypothetical protein [Sphingomonas bacterium]